MPDAKEFVVFYSWQSNISNNRAFVQDVLDQAVQEVIKDPEVNAIPIIDRDTKGVPGSPDIAATIYDKIDRCDLFVADVTIINSGCETCRPTPNSNVLIELGYALKAVTDKRVVTLVNTFYSPVDDLPFDLKTKRVLTYSAAPGYPDRTSERKRLVSTFVEILKSTITFARSQAAADAVKPVIEQAIEAVENQRPAKLLRTRSFMTALTTRLIELEPSWSTGDPLDEILVNGIEASTPLVADYARMCEIASGVDDTEVVNMMSNELGPLMDRFASPVPDSNAYRSFYKEQFEYYKFIAPELFTILIGKLLRDGRYKLVSEILAGSWQVSNINYRNKRVRFTYLNEYLYLLDGRKIRLKQRWITPHGQLLDERHRSPELSEVSPINDYIEADIFLYLRAYFEGGDPWVPWTAIYGTAGGFLSRLLDPRYRDDILLALGTNLARLRTQWSDIRMTLYRYFPEAKFIAVGDFNPDQIIE